jgi:Ca2+-binding RTX toxin-like protein
MANLIGGIAPYRGINNLIVGTASADFIFGDPYTTGNVFGVPAIGGPLAAGRGGDDLLIGLGGNDWLFGDAWEIRGLD